MKKRFRPKVLTVLCILGAVLCLLAGRFSASLSGRIFCWHRAWRKWDFWQYTDTALLEGCGGTEPYVDCNVFSGTAEELTQYIL